MNTRLPSPPSRSLLDRCDGLGSILSSLCAVHCLCMPVLVGLLPVLGLTFLAGPLFERAVSLTMIAFASACVWTGCRVHQRWGLLGLLGTGAAMVLFIQFAGAPEEKEETDWQEAGVMAVGGSLIAASHLLNRRLRARCHCAACATTVTIK